MRWAALGLAAAVAGFLCYQVHLLRADVQRATEAVNERLPAVIANTDTTAKNVAALSKDVNAVRELLAPTGDAASASIPGLARYADDVLRVVEAADVKISSRGAKARPGREWAAGERREAAWLTVRARSRREMFDKLTHTAFGSPWQVEAGGKPVPLADWLVERKPDLAPGE